MLMEPGAPSSPSPYQATHAVENDEADWPVRDLFVPDHDLGAHAAGAVEDEPALRRGTLSNRATSPDAEEFLRSQRLDESLGAASASELETLVAGLYAADGRELKVDELWPTERDTSGVSIQTEPGAGTPVCEVLDRVEAPWPEQRSTAPHNDVLDM